MKLLPILEHIISEGLNLPKKQNPVIYRYQTECYPDGDPHSGKLIFNSDECYLAKYLQELLEEIEIQCPPRSFKIKDINLFDKYQGPYANVEINGEQYEIWTSSDEKLFISGYPINNSPPELNPGFEGYVGEIVDVITNPQTYHGD